MLKTNNSSLLLRLEQKILGSINIYVESGEQFLNLPDREAFDDEFIKFKAKNIKKVLFCLDNNKFYLSSNGGVLPSDKFVVLFDEENSEFFLVMIFISCFSNITSIVIRRTLIWILKKGTLGQL